jgi:hypothetical protein
MEKQIDSQVVKAGSSTYFFDLKKTKEDKPFLVITQSRFKGEGSERLRASLIVFPEYAQDFMQALKKKVSKLS